MISVIAGIAATLAQKGLGYLSEYVTQKGQEALDDIAESTGIDLAKETSLSAEQIETLQRFWAENQTRILSMMYENVKDARQMYRDDSELQKTIALNIFRTTNYTIHLLVAANIGLAILAKKMNIDSTVVLAAGNVIGLSLNHAMSERRTVLEFLFGSSVGQKANEMINQFKTKINPKNKE